jgi:outer membrane lipopolysaccharide assembly protein LptE/RlpB
MAREAAVKRLLIAGCLMLALALALGGCGYNFRGKTNNLPSDVRTIAIPVFKNNTGETRIESTFTDQVIFQFTRSQILRVTSEGNADAVLRGTVTRADVEDVAYTTSDTSQKRRITIAIKATLTRTRDGKVLWQRNELKQQRTFTVGSSPQTTEANKQIAVTELAKSMAQTLHDSVFENF